MEEFRPYLELIIGPMFSGKTSYLINIYKQYIFCNIPILVINHSLDTRYSNTHMTNHDLTTIPSHFIDSLNNLFVDCECPNDECPNGECPNDECPNDEGTKKIELKELYNNSKVIIINEGQFFGDLQENVKKMLNDNKKVYIAGLDSDFKREKFGYMLDLIPICDNIVKLTSLCSICRNGTKAIFSMRITDETTQTLIGNSNYIPVCRTCYK